MAANVGPKSTITSSVNGELVLEACLKIEYERGMNLWMSRVPFDSNIEDNPSRGHLEPFLSGGCCRQHVDVQLMWNALLYVARGEALTSNAFPLKNVRVWQLQCEWSWSLAVRFNYAVQRIAAETRRQDDFM